MIYTNNTPIDLARLAQLPLFRGIVPDSLESLLKELCPTVHRCGKGDILLLAGQENHHIRILLEGHISANKISPGGHEVAITRMGPGGVFGDVLSGSSTPSPVTVTALEPCTVMALPYERVIIGGSGPAHTQLLRNLVGIISDKYFTLSRRVDLLILKSLRAKLCAWLLEQSRQMGSLSFTSSLNRMQLAAQLNCERSALSRELSRMCAEGLLKVERSHFTLLKPDEIEKQYEGELTQ